MKACQSELNIRMMNKQIRALKQAGFPTQKRFEELSVEDLPDDGRMVLPDLKLLILFMKPKMWCLLVIPGLERHTWLLPLVSLHVRITSK